MSERSERITWNGRSAQGHTRTGLSHETDWTVCP